MQVKKIDGEFFKNLIFNGCENLRANYQYVDSLNVFPVPDGDTGTNMKMTIEGGVNEVFNVTEPNICEMSKKISRGMLMGARGNSGVILSQLFRGLSIGFEGKIEVDSIRLARAFQRGVEQAYKAVKNPVEGTILTVAKDASKKMLAIANSKMSINEFFREYLMEVKESINRTPDLLPVLKEAGVVDSGATGYMYIIEGMYKFLEGEPLAVIEKKEPETISVEFAGEHREGEFGYCTEFILKLKDEINQASFDEKTIFDRINPLGNSIVIVKDEDIVKVHIHTLKPGDILNIGQEYGEYLKLKIENMTVQHNAITEITHVPQGECPCGEEHIEKPVKPEIRKKYAIVAVGTGEGLINLFKELGTDFVVSGGQSMNPSTEDFIRGFDTLNADNIIVFPNNKNIILAANQAAKIYTDSKVTVIETKTISQGYSALTMMDLSLELDDLVESLKETIANVTSGQVTYAVRNTKIGNVQINKGDFIGICNGQIVTSRRSRLDALKDLIRLSNANEKDLLTIIVGKDVPSKEITSIKKFVEKNYTDLELEIIDGGQDVYSYITVLE